MLSKNPFVTYALFPLISISEGTLPSGARFCSTASESSVTPMTRSSTTSPSSVTSTLNSSPVSPVKVGSKLPSEAPVAVSVSPVSRSVTSTVLPGGTAPGSPPTFIVSSEPAFSATASMLPVGTNPPPPPVSLQETSARQAETNNKNDSNVFMSNSSCDKGSFYFFFRSEIDSGSCKVSPPRQREIERVPDVKVIEQVLYLEREEEFFPFRLCAYVIRRSGGRSLRIGECAYRYPVDVMGFPEERDVIKIEYRPQVELVPRPSGELRPRFDYLSVEERVPGEKFEIFKRPQNETSFYPLLVHVPHVLGLYGLRAYEHEQDEVVNVAPEVRDFERGARVRQDKPYIEVVSGLGFEVGVPHDEPFVREEELPEARSPVGTPRVGLERQVVEGRYYNAQSGRDSRIGRRRFLSRAPEVISYDGVYDYQVVEQVYF